MSPLYRIAANPDAGTFLLDDPDPEVYEEVLDNAEAKKLTPKRAADAAPEPEE